MPRILETVHSDFVASIVLDALDEAGYNEPTEAIAGLVTAILTLVENAPQDAQEDMLDEAHELMEIE